MSLIAERIAQFVAEARTPVILTGAGMSAEAGVPTFRDAQSGYWSKFDPAELATPEAFRRQPDVVFGWYMERLRSLTSIQPHPGYNALVQLESVFESLPIITQNVDGLHRLAGSMDVTELHGSLTRFKCVNGHDFPLRSVLAFCDGAPDGPLEPPVCSCGSRVRPDVVWFGEMLPEAALIRAERLMVEADVVIVVGTSHIVYPAAALPQRARAMGATVVEINPGVTPFTEYAEISWPAPAGEALSKISELVLSIKAAT